MGKKAGGKYWINTSVTLTKESKEDRNFQQISKGPIARNSKRIVERRGFANFTNM